MTASKGHHAPMPKAAPAIPTSASTTEALNHALLAAHYLRKDNIAAARRKAVQLLKILRTLEVATAANVQQGGKK